MSEARAIEDERRLRAMNMGPYLMGLALCVLLNCGCSMSNDVCGLDSSRSASSAYCEEFRKPAYDKSLDSKRVMSPRGLSQELEKWLGSYFPEGGFRLGKIPSVPYVHAGELAAKQGKLTEVEWNKFGSYRLLKANDREPIFTGHRIYAISKWVVVLVHPDDQKYLGDRGYIEGVVGGKTARGMVFGFDDFGQGGILHLRYVPRTEHDREAAVRAKVSIVPAKAVERNCENEVHTGDNMRKHVLSLDS